MSDSFWTPWSVAHQAPLSMGFPRQEYWSGLPFPSLEDLPDPGLEPVSSELAGGFFTTEPNFPRIWPRFDQSGVPTQTLIQSLWQKEAGAVDNSSNILSAEVVSGIWSLEVMWRAVGFHCFGCSSKMCSWTVLSYNTWLWSWLLWAFPAIVWVTQYPFRWLINSKAKLVALKVKEESEKVGLKLNIQKTKIMASGPITSWEIDGETVETVRLYFFGLQNHCRWWLQPWN